jgi:hypothetical protein
MIQTCFRHKNMQDMTFLDQLRASRIRTYAMETIQPIRVTHFNRGYEIGKVDEAEIIVQNTEISVNTAGLCDAAFIMSNTLCSFPFDEIPRNPSFIILH